MIAAPKKLICGLLCAAAIVAFALCCQANLHRSPAPSYAKPELKVLAATALSGSSSFGGMQIVLEGYWDLGIEGIGLCSATTSNAEGVLMRPDPLWHSPPPRFSVYRFLPGWLCPDPVIVEHHDYVRVTGTYHATGYAPTGQILESCGWLEFSTVERWDARRWRWRSADLW